VLKNSSWALCSKTLSSERLSFFKLKIDLAQFDSVVNRHIQKALCSLIGKKVYAEPVEAAL
jgi:hypothetical protein